MLNISVGANIVSTQHLERYIRMGSRPPGSSQILGDRRRPPQRQKGLLLLPHRLAAGAQTSRCHREGGQAGAERPARRQSCNVSEEVS